MTEDIAIVQACHGDLRNNHLEEGREGGENTELVSVETEASGCCKVTALHDTRWNEHFGMFLVDHLETGGTLQVALSRDKLVASECHKYHLLSMTMTFLAASSLESLSSTKLTASPNTARLAPVSLVEPM